MKQAQPPSVAFFAVCNARDFIALAALINSIRAVGHRERIYVTDCGLTAAQRRVLKPHVTFLEAPDGYPPFLMKTHGALEIDPEVAIILDADVILLRSLADLVGDRPVFFRDPIPNRFHPDWEMLGLGPMLPLPYVNSGHCILPRQSGLLPRFREAIERMLEIVRGHPALATTPTSPFFYADQDALAALVATLAPESHVLSEEAAYWPFVEGVEDARLLHHIIDKPWLTPLRPSVYTRQMIKLLGRGPVCVPAGQVPGFVRAGARGGLTRQLHATRHAARDTFRGRLGIRDRFAKSGGSVFFAGVDAPSPETGDAERHTARV